MSESRGFHLNLVNTGIAVACFFAFFRLLFWVFDPSEFLTMALCVLVPLAAYGVQPVVWSESSSTSIFGFPVRKEEKIHQQLRIFGLIPVGKPKVVQSASSYFSNKPLPTEGAVFLARAATTAIPFGGLALGISRKSGGDGSGE